MDLQDLQLFAAECAKCVLMKSPEGTYFIVVLHLPGITGSAIAGNVPPKGMAEFLRVVNNDLEFFAQQGLEEN